MRQELKIGLGLGALAIAFIAGYVASTSTPPVEERSPLASEDATTDRDVAPGAPDGLADAAGPGRVDDLPGLSHDETASPSPVALYDTTLPTDRPSSSAPPVRDDLSTTPTRITVPSTDRTGLAGSDWTTDTPDADDDAAGELTDAADVPPPVEIESMPERTHLTADEGPRQPAESVSLRDTATTRPAVADTAEARERALEIATVHQIQPGETFSALAVKYLGHAKHTDLIAKANPSLDPHRLFVGAKVNIPARPEESAPALEASPSAIARAPAPADAPRDATAYTPPPIPDDRRYVVQAGEGWYDLARRFLGDGNRWPELLELNRDRVPRDPRLLKVGAVIELPEGTER